MGLQRIKQRSSKSFRRFKVLDDLGGQHNVSILDRRIGTEQFLGYI